MDEFDWRDEEMADALGLECADLDGERVCPIPADTQWYVVSWPEHILTPQYNGDANYAGPFSRDEAIDRADEVYGE
jgi:hypothetical protein